MHQGEIFILHIHKHLWYPGTSDQVVEGPTKKQPENKFCIPITYLISQTIPLYNLILQLYTC